MSYSPEQTTKDQAAQDAWFDSWAGWADPGIDLSGGEGWNALHQQSGGAWPLSEGEQGSVPDRFYS